MGAALLLRVGGIALFRGAHFLDVDLDHVARLEEFVADEVALAHLDLGAADHDGDGAIAHGEDFAGHELADVVLVDLVELGALGVGDLLAQVVREPFLRGGGKVGQIRGNRVTVALLVFRGLEAFVGFFRLDLEVIVLDLVHNFLDLGEVNRAGLGVDGAFDDGIVAPAEDFRDETALEGVLDGVEDGFEAQPMHLGDFFGGIQQVRDLLNFFFHGLISFLFFRIGWLGGRNRCRKSGRPRRFSSS